MAGKKGFGGQPGRSGGYRPGAGRKRQLVVANRRGEHGAFLRHGDTVAVIDASGPTIATVAIADGVLVLTNDRGQALRIVLDGGSAETAP